MIRRLLVLGALALVPLGVQPSQATFVASSTNAASTFATAPDFNTVAVALDDPGALRKGVVALSATASSARGISEVRFEHALGAGGPWASACTDTSAPYACDWSSVGHDGLRQIRAVARDAAGYERVDLRADRRIDNTAPALTFAPPAGMTGTVDLAVSASDPGGSGVAAGGVTLAYRRTGDLPWTPICTRSSGASTCAWHTSGLANGTYELRATATDATGNEATIAVTRGVDHVDPTSELQSWPPPNAKGVVAMTVNASDAGSGIQSVVFQARQKATATWFDVCTDTTAPYECSGNTVSITIPGMGTFQVPDGEYEMRGIAYDAAGNAVPTPIVGFRVDNTAPTGTVTTPAPALAGTVTLGTTAADAGAGIASVRFDRSTAGANTWTGICTDTTAPFTCDWAVPAADQSWDLRVLITDKAGNTTYSNPAVTRPGGTPPAAFAIGGVNGGVAGTLDAGDTFTFAYSEAIAPGSIVSGWNGLATRPVTVTVAATDAITIGGAALGTLQLGRDVTGAGATFAATLDRTSPQEFRLILGPLGSGAVTAPATGSATLTWTPGAAATDTNLLPVTTAPVGGGETL